MSSTDEYTFHRTADIPQATATRLSTAEAAQVLNVNISRDCWNNLAMITRHDGQGSLGDQLTRANADSVWQSKPPEDSVNTAYKATLQQDPLNLPPTLLVVICKEHADGETSIVRRDLYTKIPIVRGPHVNIALDYERHNDIDYFAIRSATLVSGEFPFDREIPSRRPFTLEGEASDPQNLQSALNCLIGSNYSFTGQKTDVDGLAEFLKSAEESWDAVGRYFRGIPIYTKYAM